MSTQAKWLLALVLAALLAPEAPQAADVGGQLEAGIYTQDIGKSGARVNEYSRLGSKDKTTGYGEFDYRGVTENSAVDLNIDVLGSENPQGNLQLDIGRIFRLRAQNSELRHQLDHDRIDYLNAAVPGANLFGTNNPGAPLTAVAGVTSTWNLGISPDEELNPNNVPGFIGRGSDGNWYASNLAAPVSPLPDGTTVSWQQVGRASVFGEDFAAGQVFEITRKEAKANTDLTLPFLPNVTFHAGVRMEQREGTEQSIGMSKCATCHVTGSSRKVDEKTEEFSAGATGRFGLLTVNYGFRTSEFRERAVAPTRVYDPALSPSPATIYEPTSAVFDNRLLYDYEDGPLVYDQTPDSEKKSHVLKARMDFSRDTALMGSFVNSRLESKKTDEPGIWTLGDNKLTNDYDGYSFRLATKLTDTVRLNLRGKLEKVEADDSVIIFEPMGTTAQANLGGGTLPATIAKSYHSIESRDVVTLGTDLVWRLARRSSLRLGYEFKADDRDDEHYGKTTRHTAETSFRTVLAKGLTFRAGYTFQAIDNPLMHENAAGYIDPLTGLHYTDDTTANRIGTGELYGTAFYDLRQTDLSNQPEIVHEGKVSSTWSPASNMSATAMLRYRNEWNDLDRSEWKQQTFSPTLSFWYAPAQKLNLTFAYNYLGQRTESRFCQGWYDG